MEDLINRFQKILDRIANAAKQAGRNPQSVRLVAVSKTQPFEAIRELYQAGHRDFGENYVQELLEKAKQAQAEGLSELRWHFVGHLQTNKVKALLPVVSVIHAVDSVKLAAEISKRSDRDVQIFISVNLDSQDSKSGIQISELRKIVQEIATLPRIQILGLMCIPDPNRPGGLRDAFKKTADLQGELRAFTAGRLSMGMTSDFEEAIAEGASEVRVGSAIFGERSPLKRV